MSSEGRPIESALIHSVRRTAQLEEKLDGIVSLLTNAPPNAPTSSLNQVPNSSKNTSFMKLSADHQGGIPTPPFEYASTRKVLQQATSPGALSDCALPIAHTDQDEHALYELFPSLMAVHFPFVLVEPNTNGEMLQYEKPLLYRVIIMVAACRDVSRHVVLRQDIMKDIMDRLLIRNEKSLELLQGLLLLMAWFHYHLPLPQLTNLIQLALALSYDLCLNKSLGGNAKYERLMEESKCANERLAKREMRKLDERRAFLGVFWLQSA